MTNILEEVSKKLHESNLLLVSAESCTGGWLAKQITDLSGSSAIFDRGFVTYTNTSKHEMLGVLEQTLDEFGAVSEEVVIEMVAGALLYSKADIAVAISGVAGPTGGTKEKPVGMVCFAWKLRNKASGAETRYFKGDRNSIREQAVDYAFSGIISYLDSDD
jgi:nicotinamide-nucleotide amidase